MKKILFCIAAQLLVLAFSLSCSAARQGVYKQGDILESRIIPWADGMNDAVIARTTKDLVDFYNFEKQNSGSFVVNMIREKRLAEVPVGSVVKIIRQHPNGISEVMLLDQTDRIGFVLTERLAIKRYGW